MDQQSLEDECFSAFANKDHDEAVRLLPLVKKPTAVIRLFDRYKYPNLLHLSSRNSWLDVMEDLITNYLFDPQEVDRNGWSCLHYAAEGNYKIRFMWLVELLSSNACCAGMR